MFDNPGSKIKAVAIVSFWLVLICSLIGGIALITNDSVVLGIVSIIAGSIEAYISSLLLAGFGELVENSSNFSSKDDEATAVPRQSSDSVSKNVPIQESVEKANSAIDHPIYHSVANTPLSERETVTPVATSDDPTMFICPKCNTRQLSNRKVCFRCGVKFQ